MTVVRVPQRWRRLGWGRAIGLAVAGPLGALVALAPALAEGGAAPPSTASFTAIDNAWQVSGTTDTSVTIAPGGKVTFGYPHGMTVHNADFGSGPAPTSCAVTAGLNIGSVPPLPRSPAPPGWSGTCTFNTPGTYHFYCDQHPTVMRGTIVVSTGTTTTGTNTTRTQPSGTGAGGSPLAGTPARAVVVPGRQHGSVLAGTVAIAKAGAGWRLEIDLLASLHRHAAPVRVGRFGKGGLMAGKLRFRVALSSSAVRVLRSSGRLSLGFTLILRPPHGSRVVVTRKLVQLR